MTKRAIRDVSGFCNVYILEEEMETHSRILAWKIPWTVKPGGLYRPWGHKESGVNERLSIQCSVYLDGSYVGVFAL